MTVLVAYASKHGATRDIADRIATTLTAAGQAAEARAADQVTDIDGYDAFVIGAAAYYGHWLHPATAFIKDHEAMLADLPVWLFSSGPLGTGTTDAQGHDVREAAAPREFDLLRAALHIRGERVFPGALDTGGLTMPERAVRRMPAGRALLPEGDFREWDDIDAWSEAIARELSATASGTLRPDSEPVS